MKDFADLLYALTALAWPLIVGLVIWQLFPTIKRIAESRGFTVKVGTAELTVQELSEKILKSTADIQGKLASVSTSAPTPTESRYPPTESEHPAHLLRRILWVDDNPSNNAYEVAQLQTLGVDVVQVASTRRCIEALSAAAPPFDAVLSGMARHENSGFHPDAGLELAKEIRARGGDVPVFIYTSDQALARRSEILEAILKAGGNDVAASPTALFTLLRKVGEFPREYG
ncbi:two-component response regulator [Streptomyces sp. NBRC 110611]|uniref:response regulator n=1 Tax=Streptomyces sp. NBRC 110611 TaxID=1621259 RepID=UPI00082C5107|nr:response regulator [Streptomyces sp. NBRC 110611]GAU69162.1 two-component response regulator [Streptomyces sp. NBRC 110611]